MICRMATVLLLLVLSVGAVSSAPITSDDVHIIDGDTIRLHHQKPDIRLVGFNAPETRRAMCEAERDLGDKATARLRKLVRSNKLDFEFVACACQQPPPIHANAEPHYAPNVWLPGCGRSRRHAPHVRLVVDMFLPDA